MKVSDTIKKETKTLSQRGLHDKSFFHVTFGDDSEANEADYSWHDFSDLKRVKYQGATKSVMVSNQKIKHIKICHNDREVEFDVPDDCDVYQAVRSETMFVPKKENQTRVVGRCVGLVQGAEVVQEVFINGLQDSILGWKK